MNANGRTSLAILQRAREGDISNAAGQCGESILFSIVHKNVHLTPQFFGPWDRKYFDREQQGSDQQCWRCISVARICRLHVKLVPIIPVTDY
jgi:hypothetical protein